MHSPAICDRHSAIAQTVRIFFLISISFFLTGHAVSEQAAAQNSGYLDYKNPAETAALLNPEEAHNKSSRDASFSDKQELAREYRAKGLQQQRIGDANTALSYYQKAVELDPAYAVAYNDIGIIYESKGKTDEAEASYLKALDVDPYYLSAHTNLALLYEGGRLLRKAALHWQKRAELGPPNDPWTQKARARYEDIRASLGETPEDSSARESRVLSFMQHVSQNIDTIKSENASVKQLPVTVQQDNLTLSREHFEKAKEHYVNEHYVQALNEAVEAQQLNPTDRELNSFVEELQKRLLSQ